MYALDDHPYLVPFDSSFDISAAATAPPEDAPDEETLEDMLDDNVDTLADLQELLYAHDRYGVLTVFQAMDAAGKDSTIRKVFSGVNPAGFQVSAFKKPSSEELDHDFLWRSAKKLPERGRIGVFNRSYYEETLVVQVHPEILDHQKLPSDVDRETIWEDRYASIRDHEKHLARNGTVVVKFFLNVSREEQLRRFLKRIVRPDKNWKFEANDVKESRLWEDYMAAYQATLRATSRPWAPWYVIPADDKDWMRLKVSEIMVETLGRMDMRYPELDDHDKSQLVELRAEIEGLLGIEGGG